MTSMRTTTAVVAAVLVFVLLCITAAQPETAYGTGATTTVPGGSGDCSVIGGVLSCGVVAGGKPDYDGPRASRLIHHHPCDTTHVHVYDNL